MLTLMEYWKLFILKCRNLAVNVALKVGQIFLKTAQPLCEEHTLVFQVL